MHLCIVLVNASVKENKYYSGMVKEVAYLVVKTKIIFSSQKQAMRTLLKVPVGSHCKQPYMDSKTMSPL